VGLIGMGRIGYAIAFALGPYVARVIYNARRARPGLPFQPLPVEEVLSPDPPMNGRPHSGHENADAL
jgi:phosphoglycerate dehydrogenase-like enzyme